MWRLQSLVRPSKDDGNNNGDNEELSGLSKEELEWQRAQHERVCQRMPQILHKVDIKLQRARRHFLDDPEALKQWNEYEEDVRNAFGRNLHITFSSLLSPPDSVLYKHLMKRKAPSKTYLGMPSGGLDRLKQASRSNLVGVGIASTVVVGLAVGTTLWPWMSKETVGTTRCIEQQKQRNET